jgi:drug/metabolite transporter (DMT)-like permease
MTPTLLAITFGLASALSWGAGDFCGGIATRRAQVFSVLIGTQFSGLALVILCALLFGEAWPAAGALAWGAVAGLAGGIGLAALYRALAIGRMGLVAPISAVLAAVIPMVVGGLTQGLPGGTQLAGFAVAGVAVWLIAGSGGGPGTVAGLEMALLAGCGFGAYFVLTHQATAEAPFWPIAAARTVGGFFALAMATTSCQALLPERPVIPLVLLSGALDVGGNVCFALAAQAGRLDVAAVLSSLYPASTVLLAGLVLGERLSRAQTAGVAAALAAIVLVAR